MEDIRKILGQILKTNPGFQENRLKIEVYEAWPRVVGERVAKHCWPVMMIGPDTLLVGAESSVWLQSLRYLEAQILDKYEKELKGRRLKHLKFKIESQKSR